MTATQPQLKADLRLQELLELFEWGFHRTVEEWEKCSASSAACSSRRLA